MGNVIDVGGGSDVRRDLLQAMSSLAAGRPPTKLPFDKGSDGDICELFQKTMFGGDPMFMKHSRIADAARKEGKYELSLVSYNAAIPMAPKLRALYTGRAITYLALGRFAEAIKDLDTTIRMRPDDPHALLRRACAYARRDDHISLNRAIRDITQALSLDAELSGVCLRRRAAAHYDKLDYGSALTDIERLIAKTVEGSLPKRKTYETFLPWCSPLSKIPLSGLHARRAQCLSMLGRSAEAIQACATSVHLLKTDNSAWVSKAAYRVRGVCYRVRAECHAAEGRDDQAIAEYRKMIRAEIAGQDEKDDEDQDENAAFEFADDADRFEEMHIRLEPDKPGNAFAFFYRAYAAWEHGRCLQAEAYCLEAAMLEGWFTCLRKFIAMDKKFKKGIKEGEFHVLEVFTEMSTSTGLRNEDLREAVARAVSRSRTCKLSMECATCGKDSDLKKCSGCKAVAYCSRECQVADWKARHKSICRKIRKSRRQ